MLSTGLHIGRTRFVAPVRGALSPTVNRLVIARLVSTASSPSSTQPRHSYQPHPSDPSPSPSLEGPSSPSASALSPTPTPTPTPTRRAPAAPATAATATKWRPSRPHEQYLLSHPVYTPAETDSVKVLYLEPKTPGDRIARFLVNFSRKGFDFVTRYKHANRDEADRALKREGKEFMSLEDKRRQGFVMTVDQWMARILFLESIAGVPGFTAAILRHLRSLRLMKRDGGMINVLLAEAENERMHLLTFMKIKQPSKFFRLLVLGAQGVFFNLFFLAYILSPRSAHRFVAYLEEEACYTYTHALEALDKGELPEWDEGNQKVPTVAKDYWRLGDNATMRDLILAVRADEAGHRFVNHTFANLEPGDFNPVALKHASPVVQGQRPGFTRDESIEWLKNVEREMRRGEQEEDLPQQQAELEHTSSSSTTNDAKTGKNFVDKDN